MTARTEARVIAAEREHARVRAVHAAAVNPFRRRQQRRQILILAAGRWPEWVTDAPRDDDAPERGAAT